MMEFVDFLLGFVFACVIALAFITRGMFIDSGKPTANPAMRIRCYSNDDYKEVKPVIRKYKTITMYCNGKPYKQSYYTCKSPDDIKYTAYGYSASEAYAEWRKIRYNKDTD